jgi:hypothetical protein
MAHRIAPNGGGTRVNQYTLDHGCLRRHDRTGPRRCCRQFVEQLRRRRPVLAGVELRPGHRRLQRPRHVHGGAWHRVVAAYDMAANPPVVTKYVDGIKQDDWTANQGLDNARRALQPTAILFGDGDQDERREMYVNSDPDPRRQTDRRASRRVGRALGGGHPDRHPAIQRHRAVGLRLRGPWRHHWQAADLFRRR